VVAREGIRKSRIQGNPKVVAFILHGGGEGDKCATYDLRLIELLCN
jgi:hypothetical protein